MSSRSRKLLIRPLFLVIGASLLQAPSHAGDEPTQDPVAAANAVPVEAVIGPEQRRGSPFPLPEITVSSQAEVAPPTLILREVSAGDLAVLNAHTVGDGLTFVPGVNVQYGGTSGDARAWIRGFRDRDTLVLFDGIPIASGFEGTIDLNEIATEQVSEIKVMKSAPSVIYGTNGMGGVIDILPRLGSGASRLQTKLEVGSDESRLVRASSGDANEHGSYMLTLSHEEADDYRLSSDYAGDLNQPAGDRINSDFRRSSLFLALDGPETPIGHASFFYNVSDARKGLPPTAGVEDPDFERLVKSTRQTLGISNRFSGLPLSAKLYYNSYESELAVYTDGTYGVIEEIERSEDYSYGAKLYSRLQTHDNNTLVLHGAMQTDVFKAEGELENGNKAELATWTLAVEDQYWVVDTLSLAVGAIYNLVDQTRLNRSTTALSPQVALAWQASEALAVHASAARRTRFPKLRELYRRRYGNPDLEEQTADNYEFGLSVAHSPHFTSDAAVFYSEVNGLIERPDRRSPYQNLAPVTIKGAELSSGGRVTDKAFTRLSYTYVEARESLPGGGSRQLRSRPEHTVQVELRYEFEGGLLASLSGIHVSGLHDLDDDNVYTELDSYVTLNAKVAKDFTPRSGGYVAVSNLLDVDYAHRLGDPRPGRSIRIGFDFRL